MLVYKAEKDAGLESVLSDEAKASIILEQAVKAGPIEGSFKNIIERITASQHKQEDLYYMNSILVSTVWNGNDDVFLKEEVWAARHSPEDKPFNYGHNQQDIIGHIVGNYCIDDDGNQLADDLVIDDVPNKFHVVTGSVLYKAWSDKDLRDRITTIIAEIEKNEWFVSMECLFRGFDYALRNDSESHIVARTKDSAFLTKHLRAYGGTGEYQGYKVGRAMRNIVFSGKGLVRKPANAESIIWTQASVFTGTQASTVDEVLNNMSVANEQEIIMGQETLETLQAKITTLDSIIADLNNKLIVANQKVVDSDTKTVKAELDTTKATLDTANSKVVELTNKLTEITTAKTQADEQIKTLTASEKAAKEELASIKAAQVKAERIAKLEKAGLKTEDAVAKFEKFANLDDETFASVVSLIPAPVAPTEVQAEQKPSGSKEQAQTAKAALEGAQPTEEINLNTGSDTKVEESKAELGSFLTNILQQNKKK